MKEKVVYSFESIILQLLIITQSYQLKVVSWWCVYQFDLRWLCIYHSMCIKLTSVDCVYINFSIWPQLTVCLHLMVCVSNWPQLNVKTYISVSIWQCVYQSDLSWLYVCICISVSPFDSVCIKLTSIECVYISVSPFDSVCINLTSVDCVYTFDLSWLCMCIP